MTRVTDTEDGLFRRILLGDEEAFTLLYRAKHPAIYRFALHMSGNAAIAEDVTQEVFMTFIRDARRFDPARGSLGAFLFGVARNHLRRRWEQERHSVPLPEADEDLHNLVATRLHGNGNGAGPHRDELSSLETVARVRQAIASLPESYREVVILCELEEMSYEEAAGALQCPIGTVRSRLHRARSLLLEKLREGQRSLAHGAAGDASRSAAWGPAKLQ
jgi:RNA polymerase sigma-70 factor, ECF subfamily